MLNTFLFIIFPYICLSAFVLGVAVNIFFAELRISAPATGFFEKKKLFWGIVPWHFGILAVLAGHLAGLLFPGAVLGLSASNGARTVLAVIALGSGFAALFGVLMLLYRRVSDVRVSAVSRFADYFALVVLAVQIVLGLSVAMGFRWGISWYASNMSGYLWGIFSFRPSAEFVTGIPAVLSAHIFFGFLLVAVLPFTRLMHLLYVPLTFLTRKPQIVRGYSKAEQTRG